MRSLALTHLGSLALFLIVSSRATMGFIATPRVMHPEHHHKFLMHSNHPLADARSSSFRSRESILTIPAVQSPEKVNSNRLAQALKVLVVSTMVFLNCSLLLQPTAAAAANVEDSTRQKYLNTMLYAPKDERIVANEGLLDYAVGTINTMYYDNTGGVRFQPREFFEKWRALRDVARGTTTTATSGSKTTTTTTVAYNHPAPTTVPPKIHMETREGAIQALKWIVGQLEDPFSSYLTREDLREELELTGKDGFLGLGAFVQPAPSEPRHEPTLFFYPSSDPHFLTANRVIDLPVISAVTPDSPAERAGLTVGDRIVAIGTNSFLGSTRDQVRKTLQTKYSAENYIGHPELTVAKPVWRTIDMEQPVDVVVGYRQSRVRLPTKLVETYTLAHGDGIVHYDLLSDSILSPNNKVGYIRLTRFSRKSTAGYLQAVQGLEATGAQSYIIDLRNNYGGVIQEAMLTASTLLRDPHAVICYVMNSRGGFTPHDVEEYVVDKRYPGYLLSKEASTVALAQVKRESPSMFVSNGINWDPPSSFASLHEQRTRRGMHIGSNDQSFVAPHARATQKKIVLLINEGTASSAEVFAAALHDNGRVVATVGTKTFGKGLIQHTFPLPDGGGLRLTVAEYLTPALKHVTKIGSARFDSHTGAWVGGGIQPDVVCDSQQGIPGKPGADLCVGIALDILQEANSGSDLLHRFDTGGDPRLI
jgi:C-terminal processing protease CtpA/Prc